MLRWRTSSPAEIHKILYFIRKLVYIKNIRELDLKMIRQKSGFPLSCVLQNCIFYYPEQIPKGYSQRYKVLGAESSSNQREDFGRNDKGSVRNSPHTAGGDFGRPPEVGPPLADDQSLPPQHVRNFLHSPYHFDRSPPAFSGRTEWRNLKLPGDYYSTPPHGLCTFGSSPLGFARDNKKYSSATHKKAGIHFFA